MGYTIEKEVLQKYVFLALVVMLVIASYFILKPYIVALLSAFVLGFLVKPFHSTISRKTGDRMAAGICIILILLIIFIPFGMIIMALVKESYSYAFSNSFENVLSTIIGKAGFELDPNILETINREGLNFLISLLRPLVSNIFSFFVATFVMFFALYYVLVKWDFIASEIKKFIPFKDREGIAKELSVVTKEIVFGTFLVGLIEFGVALIGFYLLGINSALLLAALIFFTAFIPGIGPGFIWVPLTVYFAIIGSYPAAIGTFVLGLILGFGIDLFLRGILTGKKTNINPLIMLLGIFGGISIFGLFGFIIGPLILVYVIKIMKEVVAN